MQQNRKIPAAFLQISRALVTGAPSVLASPLNYRREHLERLSLGCDESASKLTDGFKIISTTCYGMVLTFNQKRDSTTKSFYVDG